MNSSGGLPPATPDPSPDPAPLAAARMLAPSLASLRWGIGGGTLLHHLGIEPVPVDLDIVVTKSHFDAVCAILVRLLGPAQRPQHPRFASARFARFRTSAGVGVDVMAGIAVDTEEGRQAWDWRPGRTVVADGLPWMLPEDWLHLYALFDRPERVAQLRCYLNDAGAGDSKGP